MPGWRSTTGIERMRQRRFLLLSGSTVVGHKEEIVIFYLGFIVLVILGLVVSRVVILK